MSESFCGLTCYFVSHIKHSIRQLKKTRNATAVVCFLVCKFDVITQVAINSRLAGMTAIHVRNRIIAASPVMLSIINLWATFRTRVFAVNSLKNLSLHEFCHDFAKCYIAIIRWTTMRAWISRTKQQRRVLIHVQTIALLCNHRHQSNRWLHLYCHDN